MTIINANYDKSVSLLHVSIDFSCRKPILKEEDNIGYIIQILDFGMFLILDFLS